MGRIVETEEGGGGGGGGELDYFRPKRALQLLAEGAQLRGGSTAGNSGSVANSASVHGLETLLAGDGGSSWKRGRLQCLPPPPAHYSGLHSVPVQPCAQSGSQHDVLERKRSKWRNLEPLDSRRLPPP